MSIYLYIVAAVNRFLLILFMLLRFCFFDRALILFITVISPNPRTKLIQEERLASNVV